MIFIVLFNHCTSTTVNSIFQLVPLFILDTLFGLIVNQVLGAEQKQRKCGFFPVNLQLIGGGCAVLVFGTDNIVF